MFVDQTKISFDLNGECDDLLSQVVTAIATVTREQFDLVVLDDNNEDITDSLDHSDVNAICDAVVSYRQGEEEDAMEMRAEMRREDDD